MYFQSPVTDLRNKDHYRCSSYKHDTSACSSHYISDDALQSIILENIQRVISYMKNYEDLFIREQLDKSTQNELNQIYKNKKKLEKAKNRVISPEILNKLIEKIVIHQKEKTNGKKVQEIDIYYRGVGIISFPVSLEDMTTVIEKMLNKKISA